MSIRPSQANTPQCVILCGGADEPDIARIDEIISLYPTHILIGIDRGGLRLIEQGYRLDFAVGDFDSVTPQENALIVAQTDVMEKYHSEKDDTDMELGLLLAQRVAPEADYYILGGIGKQQGRLDHLLANIWLVFQPRFEMSIGRLQFIEVNHRIHFFKPGSYSLSPAYQEQYVSLVSLTAVKQLQITGAKYQLATIDIDYPRALISNEFYDEQAIELSFEEGLIMVLHVHEEKTF